MTRKDAPLPAHDGDRAQKIAARKNADERTKSAATARRVAEFDWPMIRRTFLAPPVLEHERHRYQNSLIESLTAPALASGQHDDINSHIMELHMEDPEHPGRAPSDRSRALTDRGRHALEILSPEQRGQYAAATQSRVMGRTELEQLGARLQQDPNHLANRAVQQELESGASYGRARELNRMRARWEVSGPLMRQLHGNEPDESAVSAAMNIFEPVKLDTHALQPWEHPTGPAMNPVVDTLSRTLKDHRFENGDSLIPVVTDAYRRLQGKTHGNTDFATFYRATERFMRDANYQSSRPAAGIPQLSNEEAEHAFGIKPHSTSGPRSETSIFTTPNADRREGSYTEIEGFGRTFGHLWSGENRPSERKARNLTDMGRWYEEECSRRGIEPHPLARELYTPNWESERGLSYGHTPSTITPHPETYDTHLSRDYGLEFVPRTFDPSVDPSRPWHERLRTEPWTEDETRGTPTQQGQSGGGDTRPLTFDSESVGRDGGTLTLGHILHYPHTLVHDTFPVGVRLRDEEVAPGRIVRLPVHVMGQDGKRIEIPDTGSPSSGFEDDPSGRTGSLETPRRLYRVYHPLELHSSLEALHGNELFGHIYDILSHPDMKRNDEGYIEWRKNKALRRGTVPDAAKGAVVGDSMRTLQHKIRDISEGGRRLLVDGSMASGLHLPSEYRGLARTLMRTVIPARPEDTARGLEVIRGMENIAADTTLRGRIENSGNPGQNAHRMTRLYDWDSRFKKALAERPDDESLKLLQRGIEERVPDLVGPPGYRGNEARRERKHAGRLVVSVVNNALRANRLEDISDEVSRERVQRSRDERRPETPGKDKSKRNQILDFGLEND